MAATGLQRAIGLAPDTFGNELYDIVNNADTVAFDDPNGKEEDIMVAGATDHIEDIGADVKERETVYVPPTEQLSFFKAIKRYKYAALLCFMAGLSGWCDGYEQGMSGSIIALTGFVRQFGVLGSNGKYALEPLNVSLFTCMSLFKVRVGLC